jgi:hypothetical protein
MNRAILGMVLLIVSAIAVQVYLVGNIHNDKFVTGTVYQCITLGTAAVACIVGICLLLGKPRKANVVYRLNLLITNKE